MKVFISHGSHLKPLVHDCLKNFPEHISTWLDEKDLLLGDNLSNSFESAIKTEVDYLLLFVDETTAKSEWVKKEIKWAVEKEREINRNFLLPVTLGNLNLKDIIPELGDRKYVKLHEYAKQDVYNLSVKLLLELFALASRDLMRHQEQVPMKGPQQILNEAEKLLSTTASLIQETVFPHRKKNPITINDVYNNLKCRKSDLGTFQDFKSIITILIDRNLIPGISYDGYNLYLIEEHHLWKSTLNRRHKIEIARRATDFINNNMNVYIDAGSTTREIVEIICNNIKTGVLKKVTLTVASIDHANMITNCCATTKNDEISSLVNLCVPGGQVRPLTNAILPFDHNSDVLYDIIKKRGEFDVAIMGINGIHLTDGLTTACNDEALGKQNALKVSKNKIFVCDASKFGLALEYKVTGFEDDIKIVTNKNKSNSCFEEIVRLHPEKVIIV